jgi:hypothetical protein
MRERLLALAERRARLVVHAQAERATIDSLLAPADAAASLGTSLCRIVGRVANQARQYPLGVAAGVALLVALRPKRAITWLSRGWSLWRLYRVARGWWMRFEASSTAAGEPKQA